MQGQGQGPSLQGPGQGQGLDLQGQGQGQGLDSQRPGKDKDFTYCKLQLNLQSLSSNNNEHEVKVHNILLHNPLH